MKLLYFAWLRERIGKSGEDLTLPAQVTTLAELVEHLITLGDGYASAFCEPAAVKAAINQDFAKITDPVSDTDEVAFFPPVTGG
jgi:molybdopterin synthase sulfur carrier subunit